MGSRRRGANPGCLAGRAISRAAIHTLDIAFWNLESCFSRLAFLVSSGVISLPIREEKEGIRDGGTNGTAGDGRRGTRSGHHKGLGGRIHVRVSHFKDRDYIDVRNFYESDDGQWLPTRKGIAVPVELYGELLDALGAAKAEVDKRTAAK